MKNKYALTPKAVSMVSGSTIGYQPKYYEDGYWYKVDAIGYEGLSEYLSSVVLSCSNVKNYVEYERCTINGKPGCRSKNFLNEGESFISFQRLADIYDYGDLTGKIQFIDDVKSRIDLVIDFIKDTTGMDCTEYLSQILSLDMLTLNTDRHFHNLGLILNEDNDTVKTAPIFDNGNGLLSNWNRFYEETLEKNIWRVSGQPFSSDLERQAREVGFGLSLNYELLYQKLDKEPNSRALDALKYQLEYCRQYIPNISMNLDAKISTLKEPDGADKIQKVLNKQDR